jgi:hypothetical protein
MEFVKLLPVLINGEISSPLPNISKFLSQAGKDFRDETEEKIHIQMSTDNLKVSWASNPRVLESTIYGGLFVS